MPAMHDVLHNLREWGMPEAVFALPLEAQRSVEGLLHSVEGCGLNFLGRKVAQTTFLISEVEPWDLCSCLDISTLSMRSVRHWNALVLLNSVREVLVAEPANHRLFERVSWLRSALEQEAHVPYALNVLACGRTEAREFIATQRQVLRERAGALHDDLTRLLPRVYNQPAKNGASHSFVGFAHLSVLEELPGDIHLYLVTCLSREEFVRLDARAKKKLIVRVSAPVRDLFEKSLRHNRTLVNTAALSLESDTPAILENLHALWSPEEDGPLRVFQNAVVAARSL